MINSSRTATRTLLRSLGVAGAVCAIAATGAVSADAAKTSVHVSGRFYPKTATTWESTGDFLGTYELLAENVVLEWKLGENTVKVIDGSDKMTGCVDLNHNKKCDKHGPSGSITMTYKRLATFDAKGNFLESYCTHPIIDATGDFTGGLILMADRARDGKGGDIKSTYRGDITLG